MTALVPLFPGVPGGPELMIVLLIVVLLFGANKVPKLARASGQAMGEFKRGRDELEEEIRSSKAEPSTEVESSDAVETESA
jgi:sec-independent protein translocase protein TatA